MTEDFYILVMRLWGVLFITFFNGKGGNEIKVSFIIELVLDKMPQDEQNGLIVVYECRKVFSV